MAIAQSPNIEDIVGTYRLPNSNPEGGETVLIFENNTFATFYFGGALKGTWEIIGNEIKFKTTAYPKFYLYGRKLSTLKDSTHVNFTVEPNALVNLNSNNQSAMQPLFNKDANCLAYPYIYKTGAHLNDLVLAKQEHSRAISFDIYTFEIDKKYNDLIVIGLQDEYTTEHIFFASYKEGNLYFDSDKPASKRPASIQENKEDKAYLDEFMGKELIPQLLSYGHEFFPIYDNPTEELLLTHYTRIAPIKKEKGKVSIEKNNLFTAKCKD